MRTKLDIYDFITITGGLLISVYNPLSSQYFDTDMVYFIYSLLKFIVA